MYFSAGQHVETWPVLNRPNQAPIGSIVGPIVQKALLFIRVPLRACMDSIVISECFRIPHDKIKLEVPFYFPN